MITLNLSTLLQSLSREFMLLLASLISKRTGCYTLQQLKLVLTNKNFPRCLSANFRDSV
jgi:hypothetical protein